VSVGNSGEKLLRAVELIHLIGESNGLLFSGDAKELLRLRAAREIVREAIETAEENEASDLLLRMELYYVDMLESLLIANNDEKRQMLISLLNAYKLLATRFPKSAVVQYELSMVLYQLDKEEEASLAIMSANVLVSSDNWIKINRWTRSIIKRKVGSHFYKKARKIMRRLAVDSGNMEMREGYLAAIHEAFRAVFEDVDSLRLGFGSRSAVELHKRINNIVYYACLFLRSGGDIRSLSQGFDLNELSRLLDLLQYYGPEEENDWQVLHTVAMAHDLLGRPDIARELADRVYLSLPQAHDDLQREILLDVMSDLLAWKGLGRSDPIS